MKPIAPSLVCLTLAIVLFLPSSTAQIVGLGEDPRRLELVLHSDGFDIRSDRLVGEPLNRIRTSVEGPDVRIRFELFREVNESDPLGMLWIEVVRIVEFRDLDGDGAFNVTDEVVAEYRPVDFALASVTGGNVTAEPVRGVEATVAYAFRAFPGSTFAFVVTAFENRTIYRGIEWLPPVFRAGYRLDAFPYTQAGTRAAIDLRLKIERAFEPQLSTHAILFDRWIDVTPEDRITNPDESIHAGVWWPDTATIDGQSQSVAEILLDQADRAEPGGQLWSLTLAHGRGAAIEHWLALTWSHAAIPVEEVTVGLWSGYVSGALLAGVASLAVPLVFWLRKIKSR